jgi:hypothetical protein
MAKSIGRYEIREELGRGGMAAVYLAYDPQLGREVALKLMDQQLSGDPTFAARFEREAKTVAALEHGAIVSLYDYGEADGWLYLVMRYMKGGSLKEQIARGPLSLERAYNVVHRIGSALDKAHRMDIVHRDLKPGNILLDEEGETYLSDFGIVKVAKGEAEYLTETGQTLGTFAYMSPEQVLGKELDGRSDIYALGVVLYEMLTGKHPFGDVATTSGAMAVAHTQQPIPDVTADNPDLPVALIPVIQKALAKEPADRYGAGAEMAAAMRAALRSPKSTRSAETGVAAAAAAAGAKTAEQPLREQPVREQPPAQPPVREPVQWQPTTPPPAQPAAEERAKIPSWALAAAGVAVVACIAVAAIVGYIVLGPGANGDDSEATQIAAQHTLEASQTEVAIERTGLAEERLAAEQALTAEAESTREAELTAEAELTQEAVLTLEARETEVAIRLTELAEAGSAAEQTRIAAQLTQEAEQAQEAELTRQAELTREAGLAAELTRSAEQTRIAELTKEAEAADLTRVANAPNINEAAAYILTNRWRGEDFALAVADESGNLAMDKTDKGSGRQNWRFTPQGSGYYKITNDHLGRAWGLSLFDDGDSVYAVMGSVSDSDRQLWEFIPAGGGFYNLANKVLGTEFVMYDAEGFGDSGVKMDDINLKFPGDNWLLEFGGVACPYVFTFDPVSQSWVFDTSIIYDLVGPESEQQQWRKLEAFDGRLLIREVEPEISHLDQVYVVAVDSDGRETILTHDDALLQDADDNYLVMHQGDQFQLAFPAYQQLDDVTEVWVVAEGYYEPLWEITLP